MKEFEKIVELLTYYNEISQLFEQLDKNNDDRITFSEFKKGFSLLNEDDTDEDYLREEFSKIDTNGGGHILFDEVRWFGLENVYHLILMKLYHLVLHVYGKSKSSLESMKNE